MASTLVGTGTGFDTTNLWVSDTGQSTNESFFGQTSDTGVVTTGLLQFERTVTFSEFRFESNGLTYRYIGHWQLSGETNAISSQIEAQGSYSQIIVEQAGQVLASYTGESRNVDFGVQTGLTALVLATGLVDTVVDLLFGSSQGPPRSYANLHTGATPNLPDLAFASADQLTGNDGHDILSGFSGQDVISGGLGNDVLNGGLGYDSLNGGAGNDWLYGGGDADLFHGGEGDDSLNGGVGADTMYGDGGEDGLFGGDGDDLMSGGDGIDYLVGGLGNNTLYGDAGNDSLNGGPGADTMHGGTGDDGLFGGDGADALHGGDGVDYLVGGNGSNALYGDAGHDSLNDGDGDGYLVGGSGDDGLFGGGGADQFLSGSGTDYMVGGAGADLFIFSPGDGADTIADFNVLQDRVNLGAVPGLETFADVEARLTFNGVNTVLDLGGGDQITFMNVRPETLTGAMFDL